MAFTYPASLAGIPATQADIKASFDVNWAVGENGRVHRDTNNVNKKAAIDAYLVTETSED